MECILYFIAGILCGALTVAWYCIIYNGMGFKVDK